MECKLSLLYLGEGREDDEDEEKSIWRYIAWDYGGKVL